MGGVNRKNWSPFYQFRTGSQRRERVKVFFILSQLTLSQSKLLLSTSSGVSSKGGSSKGSEVSVREKSEDESRKVHPFIRAILKKEKSEDIAKEIIGAHLEDQKREIGPDEQNVGKEINRITENLIEVTDYLGTDLPEDLRYVQSFNQSILSKSLKSIWCLLFRC